MPGWVLGLVLTSAWLHALWSLAIKSSRNPVAFNVLQLVFPALALALAALALPIGAPLARLGGLLPAAGMAHGLYFYSLSRALEEGELSLVYPIARSTPGLLPLAAAPLLDERISPGGAIGIAIVLLGIWLVHAGRFGSWRAVARPGTAWAFATLGCTLAYSLIDKAAMVRLDALPWHKPLPVAALYFLLLSSATAVVFVPLALRRLAPGVLRQAWAAEAGRAALAAAVSLASYGAILEALRHAPVSYVVAARQASVVFALALAVTRLGERPSPRRVAGALATVVGVAVVALAGQ